MKTSGGPTRILFIAPDKKDAEPTVNHLRAADYLVSITDELETAHDLLSAQGFDYVVLSAPTLLSLLEERALLESSDAETWRRATISVAYDLRSVLSGFESTVQELSEQSPPRKDLTARLSDIKRRLSILSSFLSELVLELGSPQSAPGHFVAVDLEDAIEAAAVSIYPAAQEKRQRLVVDIEEPGMCLMAEPARLKRILMNLLDFAVRNAPVGGPVTVRAFQENGHCVIAVSIPENRISRSELRRLFAAGVGTAGGPARAGHVQASLTSGEVYGLGISLVRRIVEQQEGRIWIESQRGAGTTVFIRFSGSRQDHGYHVPPP